MTVQRTQAPEERRAVLVVDDDEALRSAIVDCLSGAGVGAREACDGFDALRVIRCGCVPCALLLDVNMPRLDGPALIAELQGDPTLMQLPVITMSAGAPPPGLKTVGHLPKPFEVGTMLALLFRACRSCACCDGEGPVIGSIFEARRRADQGAS